MKLNTDTILLVGGGTGGHIVPVFEIYKELTERRKDLKIIIIGSGAKIEKDFFGKVKDYKVLTTGKLKRYLSFSTIAQAFLILAGLVQSFSILMKNKPRLIFSKGGYVSFPITFWAKILKIPYFVHESDVESGLSNAKAFSGAKKIFLGFPIKYYDSKLPVGKVIYSGPILRSDFKKDNQKNGADFGFKIARPTILVTGGSQGSLSINKAFTKIVESLLPSYNIIHQTGGNDFDWITKFKDSLDQKIQENYFVTDFLSPKGDKDLMTEAINLADLVISRAGANTIAELAIKKKAMILIPYKYAAGDHQTKNAEVVREAGGAIVISDDRLSSGTLRETITDVFRDKKQLLILSNNAYNFFADDGLNIICDQILEEVKKA